METKIKFCTFAKQNVLIQCPKGLRLRTLYKHFFGDLHFLTLFYTVNQISDYAFIFLKCMDSQMLHFRFLISTFKALYIVVFLFFF